MKAHIIILLFMAAAFVPEIIYIIKLFKKKASSVNLPKITLQANAGIFIMGTLLLVTAIIYDVNYLRYKAPIDYSNWEEIEWSDFRAIKRPQQTLHGSKTFAFICSEIACNYNDERLEVRTLFHPARSYTFNDETAGDRLLQHELYHLHITEYWSRKLRKDATLMEENSNELELNRIIERNQQKEIEMQMQYDDETYHGYVLSEQRNWQRSIDSCLLSLNAYSKPFVTLKN